MKRHTLYAWRWLLTCLVLIVALSACSLDGGGSGSRTATPGSGNVHRTPSVSGIRLGVQLCPDAVKIPAYWNGIIGPTASGKVEGVMCGYLMGVPTLQALVKVRYGGTDSLLDIDVYANITCTNPSRIFRLKGLPHGDVGISNFNTLLTGEIDLMPNQHASVPPTQVQQDLYREFKWSESAGTFVQVAFPGLFPDLTRYQAEFEQSEVNTGQGFQQWRLSAVTTAQNFAEYVLGWNPNTPTTVLSGGGTHDVRAEILVKNPSAGSATIKLSLTRLELNTNGGIWEVTDVATNGMALTSPQSAQQLTSPVPAKGIINPAFSGKPNTITILDHDRTEIGQAAIPQASGTGKPIIATSISYSSSFQGEIQEGIIVLYTYTGNHIIAGI